MRTSTAFVLLLPLLGACRDTPCEGAACDTGGDTADTGVASYEGPTTIDTLGVSCDETSRWADLTTVGWTGGATLTIQSSEGTTEVHPFPSLPFGYDPDGYWENLYLQLEIVSADGVAGESTVFACTSEVEATLSFLLEVRDPQGEAADCLVWGADPDGFDPECPEWSGR